MAIDDIDDIDEIIEEALDADDEDNFNSSLFQPSTDTKYKAADKLNNSFSLKQGLIVKVHELDDKSNVHKLGPEYDVQVFEQDNRDPTISHLYRNCITIDSFGGVSDYLEVKYRVNQRDEDNSDNFKDETGAMVLVLCINGNGFSGVIIGGLKHVARKTNLTKENEQHLEGEYNGLNWKIDKDGALKITYKSATDNEGKASDEEAGGTYIEVDKTGSIDINTDLTGEDQTFIQLAKEDKKVNIAAGENVDVTAVKEINLTADDNINITVTKDIIAAAEGNCIVECMKALTLKAETQAKMEAQVISIKAKSGLQMDASFIQIKGNTVLIGSAPAPE